MEFSYQYFKVSSSQKIFLCYGIYFTSKRKELLRTAKERRAGSLGYAETMLIFYTKKMKNPPAWSKLYTNKLKPGKKQKKNR